MRSAAKVAGVLILSCIAYTAAVLCGISILMNSPPMYEGISAESYARLHSVTVEHGVAMVVLLPIWLRLRRRTSLRPIVPQCMLPFTLLFFIASVDRLLGVVFPPSTRTNTAHRWHADRGWTNVPNAHVFLESEVMFDRYGLRMDELSPKKHRTDGRIRILFHGDSITYGFSLRARDTYGAQTAAILNDTDPSLDVVALNAGTLGYDTWQEWHYFENDLVHLEPDALVLEFCLNDASTMYDPRVAPEGSCHYQATHWSGIYRAIAAWAARRKFGKDVREGAKAVEHFEMTELLQPKLKPKASRAMEVVETHLERIAACCRRNDIPFVIVCFPMSTQVSNASLVPHPQQRLRRFCEQNSIGYLDLLPAFRQAASQADDGESLLFIDFLHPTRNGHAVAARALATYLEQSGLLAELSRNASHVSAVKQHHQ